MRYGILTLILITLVALMLGGFGLLVTTNARHNCKSIEVVKSHLRQVIFQDDQRLGKPGTAGYHYYRMHPDELADAHHLAKVQIKEFKPATCRGIFGR